MVHQQSGHAILSLTGGVRLRMHARPEVRCFSSSRHAPDPSHPVSGSAVPRHPYTKHTPDQYANARRLSFANDLDAIALPGPRSSTGGGEYFGHQAMLVVAIRAEKRDRTTVSGLLTLRWHASICPH